MNFATRLFHAIFGTESKEELYEGLPKVHFWKDASAFGEHGKICVSNLRHGIREVAVSFVFEGCYTPPALDLFHLRYIWQEARSQGYIPHHIVAYGYGKNVIIAENEAPALSEQ